MRTFEQDASQPGPGLAWDRAGGDPIMTDSEREGGAWIGQQPDPNTEKVRRQLDEGAERVAITDNESGATPDDEDWPSGHREGDPAGDDDVREAGHNR
jgi:hypothetical protein